MLWLYEWPSSKIFKFPFWIPLHIQISSRRQQKPSSSALYHKKFHHYLLNERSVKIRAAPKVPQRLSFHLDYQVNEEGTYWREKRKLCKLENSRHFSVLLSDLLFDKGEAVEMECRGYLLSSLSQLRYGKKKSRSRRFVREVSSESENIQKNYLNMTGFKPNLCLVNMHVHYQINMEIIFIGISGQHHYTSNSFTANYSSRTDNIIMIKKNASLNVCQNRDQFKPASGNRCSAAHWGCRSSYEIKIKLP